MKMEEAIERGKLIDNVKVYRKYQMKSIQMSKYPSNVYKAMSVAEIREVVEWYFLQLRRHIEGLERKAFRIPRIGNIRVNGYRADEKERIRKARHEV